MPLQAQRSPECVPSLDAGTQEEQVEGERANSFGHEGPSGDLVARRGSLTGGEGPDRGRQGRVGIEVAATRIGQASSKNVLSHRSQESVYTSSSSIKHAGWSGVASVCEST